MEMSENLFVIAQIAVAFAGFASLVAVIGHRRGHDDPKWDAARLEGMLRLSLFTGAFALLPFIPYQAGMPQLTTWRFCAGLFAVSGIGTMLYTIKRLRAVPNIRLVNRWGFFWMGLSVFAQIVLVLASIGWIPKPAAAYLFGLYTYLVITGLIFLRLIRSLLAEQQ